MRKFRRGSGSERTTLPTIEWRAMAGCDVASNIVLGARGRVRSRGNTRCSRSTVRGPGGIAASLNVVKREEKTVEIIVARKR